MRSNASQLRFGICVDGSRVGMLHPPARSLGRFANMKDEQVMVERSSAHQLDFILADLAQRVFHIRLFPAITVNRNGNRRLNSADPEKLKRADFDSAVGQ